MKKTIYCLLLSLSLCTSTVFADSQLEVVGYYANWTSVPFTALPVKNLTILNYAFASLQSDGSIKLIDNKKDDENFKNISELKKQQPKP